MGKMSILDSEIKLWEKEVMEREIELLKKGVPPDKAHDQAIGVIHRKRVKKNADKSGR